MGLTPQLINEDSPSARTMSFLDALEKIQDGKFVARVSWGNEDYCFMKDEYLSIFTKGKEHQWIISLGDMEGQDWVIVKDLN